MLFLLPLFCGMCISIHEDVLLQRLRGEAPSKWQQHLDFTSKFSGTVTAEFEETDTAGKATKSKMEFDCKQSEKCALFARTYTTPQGVEELVLGFNGKYRFQLKRPGKSGPWKVVAVVAYKDGATKDQDPEYLEFKTLLGTLVNHSYNRDLKSLFALKPFTLQSVRYVDPEKTIVSVKFALDKALGPIPNNLPIRSGELELDTVHSWCVRKCVLVVEAPSLQASFTSTKEFRSDSEGNPIPTRTVDLNEYTTPRGTDRARVERTFDLKIEPNRFRDTEFTLSAFGLEEPFGIEWARPTPWFMYGTIAGVAIIFLGGVLIRWSRRPTRDAA